MSAAAVPRRWSDQLGGIRWLPRLIDKARMANGGMLGAYLFGNSPVDRALLQRLGLNTAEFGALVAAAPDDAAVLAALRARGIDEVRLRRWSERLPNSARMWIRIWDIDDGYVQPTWFDRLWVAAFRRIEAGLMAAFRRISPAP